jgi:hypothetical protein
MLPERAASLLEGVLPMVFQVSPPPSTTLQFKLSCVVMLLFLPFREIKVHSLFLNGNDVFGTTVSSTIAQREKSRYFPL